ncbi:MAG: hypothetical protein IID38_06370 [Planctomycetes bacterium]|nr:hypothetical protein [Planctomycetota bacterium]
MTRKVLSMLLVLGVGSFVASAQACDKHKAAKTAAAAVENASECPHARAKLTAAGATTDGRSDAAATGSSTCSGKSKLTSAKAEGSSGKDCPFAAKAAAKAECSGKAQLTSAKAEGSCCKDCPFSGKAAAGGECTCPIKKQIDAVLASLPSMQYKVGDEVTGCSKSAGKMAKANGGKMQYVVSEQVFTDEGEAVVKLASLLESEIASLTTIQYAVGGECVQCPLRAKDLAKKSDSKIAYRVAGIDFDSREKAQKAVEAVKAALTSVKMTYKVGDQSFCCDKMAGAKAKETSSKLVYVVGDEETGCSQSAKLKLAKHKIRTIVAAAARLNVS